MVRARGVCARIGLSIGQLMGASRAGGPAVATAQTGPAHCLLRSSHLRIMLLLALLRCFLLAYGGCVSRPERTTSVPLCIAGHVDVSIYGRLESRSGWRSSLIGPCLGFRTLRPFPITLCAFLCSKYGGYCVWPQADEAHGAAAGLLDTAGANTRAIASRWHAHEAPQSLRPLPRDDWPDGRDWLAWLFGSVAPRASVRRPDASGSDERRVGSEGWTPRRRSDGGVGGRRAWTSVCRECARVYAPSSSSSGFGEDSGRKRVALCGILPEAGSEKEEAGEKHVETRWDLARK